MNKFACTLLLSCSLFAVATPSFAQSDPVESYCATLSARDHKASDGYPLDNAAAIIRQDRANYHRFNKRDRGDENDSLFSSADNRALLEQMLRGGNISRADERAIVRGTPDVCIDIYDDYIDVYVQ